MGILIWMGQHSILILPGRGDLVTVLIHNQSLQGHLPDPSAQLSSRSPEAIYTACTKQVLKIVRGVESYLLMQ